MVSKNPKLQEHREKLKLVPKKPGVYLMKNQDDRVIYVGKAKSLWNRLSQYFGASPKDFKTMQMVLHVDHFDYIITDSEKDALLLENNLIKKYKPKYNILLKDDKTYPFIKIEKETDFPYLCLVRKTEKDANKYYGPYLNAQIVNGAIELISKEYRLRTCRFDLSKRKKRPCLNYDMGYCSAPCVGNVSAEEYENQLKEAIRTLDSGLKPLIPILTEKMEKCAENLDFEGAAKFRDSIRLADKLAQKHQVVTVKKVTLDILYCYRDGDISAFSVLTVKSGIIYDKKSYTFPDSKAVTDEDMVTSFLKQYYLTKEEITKRMVIAINTPYQIPYEELSGQMSDSFEETITLSPGRGKFTKNLIEMAKVNAIEAIKLRLETKIDDQLFCLKEFLGLDQAPLRIESFDNSNTAGSNAVGVMTVFENGVLSQKEKRTFSIKNQNGSDDYAAMYEVLDRRFSHLVNSDKGFECAPDLILVDGGKGQVKMAKQVLSNYNLSIPVFGMVKDDKHRFRDLTDGYRSLELKNSRNVFIFVAKINEETHKNAISYHKKKNTMTATQSELLSISGVGMATLKKLYGHFKTVKQMKEATEEQLKSAVSTSVAHQIYRHFHPDTQDETN